MAWSAADMERLAGAIQDPTRRNILLNFYKTDESLTVDQVATRAGVHRTVAFTHLERLVALGYLATSQRRGLPGKPAKLYQRGSGELLLFQYPARQFLLLARLLVASLNGLGEGGLKAAKEVARAWGAGLGVGAARTPAEALQALDGLGTDYRVSGSEVEVRNCVFREACALAPELVCGVHGSMIEGVLAAAGLALRAVPVTPGAGGCMFELTAG